MKRNTYWAGVKVQKAGEGWSNGLMWTLKSYCYIWFACPEFLTTKLFVHVFSCQLGTWDQLLWLIFGRMLVKKSASGQYYLQVILRFSKLRVSKLYLDDTVHLCQYYMNCLLSERLLAPQLVFPQLIDPALYQGVAATLWCYTLSQPCLVCISFELCVPSQLCILLPHPLSAVDIECTDSSSVSSP